jgi:hypothetical protein
MQPSRRADRSAMFGKGYLSSAVMLLRRRKSPHGRQPPSFFTTIWSGLDQLLEERLMTPAASILSNSAFAAASLAGSSRRNFAVVGRPVVSMVCSTPCAGDEATVNGFNTPGNYANNWSHSEEAAAGTAAWLAIAKTSPPMGCAKADLGSRRSLQTSTTNW